MSTNEQMPVALVLSGGGIRAMTFHLGVLKLMAENRQLENIQKVSTVSGGSLLVGLMLQETGWKWPTSDEFLELVYPSLRIKLCDRSLMWGAARQLLSLKNWRFLLSRSNLLALALQREWGVQATLQGLPITPEWSINGTTAETGKRFRFKRENFGDYLLGYAPSEGFPLSVAMAVSAAFPGGFGPLVLMSNRFKWLKKKWGAPGGTEKQTELPYKTLHLYDGGVYDNLGLEPFFDAGKLQAKPPAMPIIVSDAGAPLGDSFSGNPLSLLRLKRVADIMSDQSRALRVRTFATYLQAAPSRGAYIQMNATVDGATTPSGAYAASFPTTLRRLTTEEFDKLAGHGYSVATEVHLRFGLISHAKPTKILQ